MMSRLTLGGREEEKRGEGEEGSGRRKRSMKTTAYNHEYHNPSFITTKPASLHSTTPIRCLTIPFHRHHHHHHKKPFSPSAISITPQIITNSLLLTLSLPSSSSPPPPVLLLPAPTHVLALTIWLRKT